MSREDGFEIVREGEVPQARSIPRALLRDSRLTFGAKGLFVFLWDLPTGWRVRACHLATVGPQGRDAVRGLLRELEEVEALRTEPVRAERGRVAGKRWILRSPTLWAVETALSSAKSAPAKAFTEGRETRLSVNPIFGNSESKGFSKPKNSASSASAEISDSPSSAPKPAGTIRAAADAGFDANYRGSGIHVWNTLDRRKADRLLDKTDPADLTAAVAAVEARAEKNEPLPARVERQMAAIARREKAKARQKQEAVSLAAATAAENAAFATSPAAQAKGEKFFRKIQIPQKKELHHAKNHP